MLREMRPSELGEWMALWSISPWGADRADLGMGVVASVIANVNRDSKKRAKPFTPLEFLPYWVEPERDERDIERERKALEKRLLAAFGLKLQKRPKKKGVH